MNKDNDIFLNWEGEFAVAIENFIVAIKSPDIKFDRKKAVGRLKSLYRAGINIGKEKINTGFGDFRLRLTYLLKDTLRFLIFICAKYARHNDAHIIGVPYNDIKMKISWYERRWGLCFFYFLHKIGTGYNTYPARFGIWVMLLLVVIFPYIYYSIDAIKLENSPANEMTYFHYLFFSASVLTTLGFGDLKVDPNNDAALLLITIEVLVGYCALALLVSLIFRRMTPQPYGPDDWLDDFHEKVRNRRFDIFKD